MIAGTTHPRGWFDSNTGDTYPLDRLADAPRSILADLSISARTLNVWIDSLVVQSGNVSLVFLGDDDVLGAITVQQAVPGVIYAFTGEGCEGTVVFGNGITHVDYRSSDRLVIYPPCIQRTLEQQQVIHRTGLAQPQQPLKLVGTQDVTVRYGHMDEAKTKPALFVGLNVSENGLSVHEQYLGPCDRRPVAGNCVGDTPIRSISSVQADCCNRIFIELQGVTIAPLVNYCGVALELDYGLASACPERNLARLTNLVIDDCAPTPYIEGDSTSGSDRDDSPVVGVSGEGTAGLPPEELSPGTILEAPGYTPPEATASADDKYPDVHSQATMYDPYFWITGETYKYRPSRNK